MHCGFLIFASLGVQPFEQTTDTDNAPWECAYKTNRAEISIHASSLYNTDNEYTARNKRGLVIFFQAISPRPAPLYY